MFNLDLGKIFINPCDIYKILTDSCADDGSAYVVDKILNLISKKKVILDQESIFKIFSMSCENLSETGIIKLFLKYFEQFPDIVNFPNGNNFVCIICGNGNKKVVKLLLDFSINHPNTIKIKGRSEYDNLLYNTIAGLDENFRNIDSNDMNYIKKIKLLLKYKKKYPDKLDIEKNYNELMKAVGKLIYNKEKYKNIIYPIIIMLFDFKENNKELFTNKQ
jgi:hypothetical protein